MYGDIKYVDDYFETTYTQMPEAEPIDSWDLASVLGFHNIFVLSIWFFAMSFNVSFLIWICVRRRKRRKKENRKSSHTLALRLASMTTDAKLAYYDKLFQTQGNQIELTKDHIIAVSPTRDAQENTNTSFDAERNDIELGKREEIFPEQNRSDNDGDKSLQDVEGDLPLVYLPPGTRNTCAHSNTCKNRKPNIKNTNETMTSEINGQCVICLEDYKAGDTIVCNMYNCRDSKSVLKNCAIDKDSSSPIGCPHVYHKTCMVKYLAKRKISQKGLQNGEGDTPSCPICRQPYIELLPILSIRNDGGNDEDASETSIDDGDSSSNNSDDVFVNEDDV